MYQLPLAPHCWVCPGSQSKIGMLSSGYEHMEQLPPGHTLDTALRPLSSAATTSSRLRPLSALRHCSTRLCPLRNGRDGEKGHTRSRCCSHKALSGSRSHRCPPIPGGSNTAQVALQRSPPLCKDAFAATLSHKKAATASVHLC